MEERHFSHLSGALIRRESEVASQGTGPDTRQGAPRSRCACAICEGFSCAVLSSDGGQNTNFCSGKPLKASTCRCTRRAAAQCRGQHTRMNARQWCRQLICQCGQWPAPRYNQLWLRRGRQIFRRKIRQFGKESHSSSMPKLLNLGARRNRAC